MMENAFKLLAAGYFVGFMCIIYLIVRSYIMARAFPNSGNSLTIQNEDSLNWFGMTMFSAIIPIVCSFIGGSIHYWLRDDLLFVKLSVALTIAVSLILSFARTDYKFEKITLNAIIVLSLGVLIPFLF